MFGALRSEHLLMSKTAFFRTQYDRALVMIENSQGLLGGTCFGNKICQIMYQACVAVLPFHRFRRSRYCWSLNLSTQGDSRHTQPVMAW